VGTAILILLFGGLISPLNRSGAPGPGRSTPAASVVK